MNIDENIFRMPIYPMLNNMNIDELNISFYVKPRPLHSRSSHTLLTTIVLLTAFDHISTNIVARWRLLLRSSATRWRLVYVPRRAVDNALTLFRVWPMENVGAIFGHASAAAQRITCLVAGFKRLFCSIYK